MKPDSSLRIFPLPGFAGEEMLWFCEEREYRTRKTITEPTEQGFFCDTLLSCYTCFVLVCVLSPLGSNSVGNETDSDHKTPSQQLYYSLEGRNLLLCPPAPCDAEKGERVSSKQAKHRRINEPALHVSHQKSLHVDVILINLFYEDKLDLKRLLA